VPQLKPLLFSPETEFAIDVDVDGAYIVSTAIAEFADGNRVVTVDCTLAPILDAPFGERQVSQAAFGFWPCSSRPVPPSDGSAPHGPRYRTRPEANVEHGSSRSRIEISGHIWTLNLQNITYRPY
jgi:hypothetical protein